MIPFVPVVNIYSNYFHNIPRIQECKNFFFLYIFRYQKPDEVTQPMTHRSVELSHLLSLTPNVTPRHILAQIFNSRAVQEPTFLSSRIVSVDTVIICEYTKIKSIIIV